ncbi:MAG TPA: hypothetical protein ENK48_06505 [Gammaproteobacteria bacterium]|nr:hypothetical protein [Gammaproteobacteria bacterium]
MKTPRQTMVTCYAATVLSWCLATLPAQAGAPVHGARAAGMNTAFTAVANDPSAILHNPAGITQLAGTRFYGGATLVLPSSSYRDPDGKTTDTRSQAFFPPHLFISRRLPSGYVSMGLGLYAPFGIGGRKWPDHGPTRYRSIESFIATVAINPTLAVKLASGWSLALGLDYMRALNQAENAVDQSALGAPDGRMEMEADGGGWGYNLGLLYRPGGAFSFGIAYRSGIKVDQKGNLKLKDIAPPLQGLFGGARYRTDVRTSVDFPALVDIGIAWRPASRWIIDVDAEWGGWSSFRKATLDLKDEVPAAGLVDSTVRQDWRDAWAYKTGVDYQVNARLSLRAGYAFLNTPVPEATLTPANPDADQHNLSLGLGWRDGPWAVDGFYNYGYFKKRRVDNAILTGDYRSGIHYLGLSLGWKH